MTGALKSKPLECWERASRRPNYSLGDISRREHEPGLQRDCERCGTLIPQQLIQRYGKGGELWVVLGCTKCPLDLGRRS